MADQTQKLKNAPIVEAVVDIDCDLPPNVKIETLETPARNHFQQEYPVVQTRMMLEHKLETKSDAPPKASVRRGIEGYLFKKTDQKQLVQVRTQGFSFNRLAPYSSLDEYLPEVERTWKLFVKLASPVQVRVVRLRYINRINLPGTEDKVELEDFLRVCPRLPYEEGLVLLGFFDQHMASETDTGNLVKTTLTLKEPEGDTLPIIFDITTWKEESAQPEDWPQILSRIQSLRSLKNRVFRNTLTERCLQLFQ